MATYSLVQSGSISATNGDSSPKDAVLSSAVKLGSATLITSVRDVRTGNQRGATFRFLNTTTVRMEWDGALGVGESIDARFQAVDIEDVGDDLKETLFRLQRILGYLGENSLVDAPSFDGAGNPILYRIRIFDTKANLAAATIDIPEADPFETGELSRVYAVQAIQTNRNDRKTLTRTIAPGDLVTTPDVG